jgi:hypothetical protein
LKALSYAAFAIAILSSAIWIEARSFNKPFGAGV